MGSKTVGSQSGVSYSYEAPLPSFFDPKKVSDWKWRVDYATRFSEANGWAKKLGVTSPARDALRIAVMPIDCQLTFCHPDFELYVGGRSGTGAIDDTARLCEFILRNLKVISKIHPTLDTHTAYQIFHATFLVDENGNHPDPRFPTLVKVSEIQQGKWKVDPRVAFAITGDPAKYSGVQQHLMHYARTLEQGGKYALTIWPFHAMLGSHGHALVPALEEVIFFHSVARGTQTDFQIKGGNPLTENYSVLRPEVLTGANGAPIAQKSTNFIKTLLENDVVVIAGQAKSHCVAWTIEDLLQEINAVDPELAKKVYLLEDCTSSVVVPGVAELDFTQQGDEAFARFAAAGMNLVKASTPISEWPGIDHSRLPL